MPNRHGDSKWTIQEWANHDKRARTPGWKRLIYRLLHGAIDVEGRRHLSRAALARWRPDFVFCRRGFPLEARRRWALRHVRNVHDAAILVQGTGSGWDVLLWAELRPRRIVATDLVAFSSWNEIARHCRTRWGVAVEFREARLEDQPFLAGDSIDLCVSNNVLEHCRDLPSVLSESRRVLRPRGTLHASFGPLWFAPGGDHFSLRAGLAEAYSHLTLGPDAYRAFFERHRREVEDFQSGGRYVELDLFSRLSTDEYLAAFADAGFQVDGLAIEVCPRALAFKRRFPARWEAMRRQLGPAATVDDLRTKTLIVRLR